MATPRLIYCADGNPKFARCAVEAGWLYGARLPRTVYETVYFADQDWKVPDRAGYMRALDLHRPHMATVLDYERPEQLPEVLAWAEQAAAFVSEVLIIPKLPDTVDDIPTVIGGKPVILAFSVPTSYGGTSVPLWEFKNRPVHLLGGSPQKQMHLARYLNVVSCDGNMAHQQAHRCRFWSRQKGTTGHWTQLSEVGDNRTEGANLEAFRRSMSEIKLAWEAKFPVALKAASV